MKPVQVASKLRQIADIIDRSKNPRRNLVAADLKRIVSLLMQPPKSRPESNRPDPGESKWDKLREPPGYGVPGSGPINFQFYVEDGAGNEIEYDATAELYPAEPDVGASETTEIVEIIGPDGPIDDIDSFIHQHENIIDNALEDAMTP